MSKSEQKFESWINNSKIKDNYSIYGQEADVITKVQNNIIDEEKNLGKDPIKGTKHIQFCLYTKRYFTCKHCKYIDTSLSRTYLHTKNCQVYLSRQKLKILLNYINERDRHADLSNV